MDRAEEGQGSSGMPVPLETFGGGGGGCSCGCCGPIDTDETADTSDPADRERTIAELKALREATVQRLAELDVD